MRKNQFTKRQMIAMMRYADCRSVAESAKMSWASKQTICSRVATSANLRRKASIGLTQ